MTFIDVVLVLLVLSGAYAGYHQGLITAACSLLGAVVCGLGAITLAPLVVQNLDSGLPRTAASIAILVVGILIGEFVGGWAGGVISDQLSWSPAKAVDRILGAVGQSIAVLGLAWLVAVPLAAAPVPGLSASIRNSAILGVVDDVLPTGTDGVTDRLRSLLNSTGFPDILGPLGATPDVAVAAPDSALSTDPVVAAVAASVLKIHASSFSCDKAFTGSGFVIGTDRVLTNAHVVGGSAKVSVEVGDITLDATVVSYDPSLDLAVLEVPQLGLPALPLDQELLAESDNAIVLGYPHGGPFTVSPARVRTTTELSGPDLYQQGTVERQIYLLRADVQPGNSGGPVIDTDGEVVGIVFGAAVDDPETGYAMTAAQIADTVAAGLTDTTAAATGACVL